MKITPEWIESISGDQGLSRGQEMLLSIWRKKTGNDGTLPDQVAHFLEGCKGYYGMTQHTIDSLSNQSFDHHMKNILAGWVEPPQ